jgi:N-methylhydantoinase B
MPLDPITTEIISNRLREVAATMEHVLYHSGYSPILRESRDGSSGLTDANGRVLVVGGGIQIHSIPYQQAVNGIIARYGRERLAPGQTYIVNDPYQAGNPHLPDMVTVTPVFYGDRLIGFGVSIAHKADIGGIVPGSSGGAAREIWHDGLILPPLLYQTGDVVNEAVEAIIRANSRIPDVVIGDLRGQIGSTRLGAARLAALCDEYGVEAMLEAMDGLLSRTAKRLSAEIATWADGSAEAENFLDHDAANRDKPVRIAVKITKTGDRVIFDYSSCDPQTVGPVNCNPWTVRAASLLALLASTDPSIPVNSGLLDCVEFIIPEGLVVNPRHPATINHYFPTIQLVYGAALACLGRLHPERAVAPAGLGCGATAIGYAKSRSGKRTVQYELAVTALGGTSEHDGASIVQPMNHLTTGAPVEIVESEYPLRVRRYDIWQDSAGAGRQRGGVGYVREFEMLEDCIVTMRGSNHKFAASGLAGGLQPLTSRTTVNPGLPGERALSAIETNQMHAGDLFRMERSGGGGYGPPTERSPDMVLQDVLDGYVSVAAARDLYRVVVDVDRECVDEAATQELRRATVS